MMPADGRTGHQAELVDYFATMLRTPRDRIRTDIHILELGADSIMLAEAQRWLRERFGCAIDMRQFFEELNTIDRIAAHLSTERLSGPKPDAGEKPLIDGPLSPVPARAIISFDADGPIDLGLMRAQLALVREVIETQNRVLLGALASQGGSESEGPAPAASTGDARPAGASAG